MLDYRRRKLSVIFNIWVNKCLRVRLKSRKRSGWMWSGLMAWPEGSEVRGGVRVQARGDQVHPSVDTTEGADDPQRGEADQSPQNLGTKIQRSQPGETRGDRERDRGRGCELGRQTCWMTGSQTGRKTDVAVRQVEVLRKVDRLVSAVGQADS